MSEEFCYYGIMLQVHSESCEHFLLKKEKTESKLERVFSNPVLTS